jgi:hypothetical protein
LAARVQAIVTRNEIRRHRENLLQEIAISRQQQSVEPPTAIPLPHSSFLARHSSRGDASARFDRPSAFESPDSQSLTRSPGARSRILAARQAKGRGTRHEPLVMLSDSE